jgi:hypothetical protein
MGLTIHYTRTVREEISLGVVRELGKRTAQYARKIGCAEVSGPLRAEEEENFLKCHLQIISLLDFWRGLGVRVKVNDEGGYWRTRSVEELRAELGGYDRLVAAVGGALKDATGESAAASSVEAPIFNYRNFERLEHEGQQEFGGRIRQVWRAMASS